MSQAPPTWDSPSAPTPREAFRRAAIAMWITGGVFVLLGGTCGVAFASFGATPFDEFVAQGEGQLRSEQIDALRPLHPLALGVAAVIGLMVFLPGLALVVGGFFVKGHHRWAVLTGLIVAMLEIALLGFAGLSSLVNASRMGDLFAGLVALLVFGLGIGLLVWTAGRLLQARRALASPTHPSADEDPWESML